jgi:predicted MFS family arabinose efflux permease
LNSTKTSKFQKASNFFGLSIGLFATIFVIRLLFDTSFRMVYPFIPQISEGLQLSIGAFSWILSIRASSGLLGPFIGTLADRFGRRKIMTAAFIALSAGMAGVALSSGWWSLPALFTVGLAATAFFPAQQAYISDQVPFERRGRALGFIETSFAFSGIFLLPLVGWIFDTWGWQVPFWILSGLSLIGAVLIWHRLPKTEIRANAGVLVNPSRVIYKRKGVLASLGVALTLFISVSMFMTFWGIWLSQDFNFGALELGLTATIIGIGELTGSLLSGSFIDRIGVRRGVLGGLFITGIFFLLIPILGKTPITIRSILAVTTILMEFSIVSLFPLYGEQAPEARATVFSLAALGTAIGFAIGPPLVASLWRWKGVHPITMVAAICTFAAFIIVWRFLFEDGHGSLNQADQPT